MKFGVGQSVGGAEDRRIITGTGCYTDDVNAGAGMQVVFLRSLYENASLKKNLSITRLKTNRG